MKNISLKKFKQLRHLIKATALQLDNKVSAILAKKKENIEFTKRNLLWH